MSHAPTHRIRDELIELRSSQPELAQALLERVSSLHRRTLVAAIDRVCSQLSPGDRVHRIDTLALELGPIDADEFEAEFVRRFEPALRSALARAIRDLDERETTAGPSGSGSAIELLELFMTTGNLPWWADRSRRQLIAEQLAEAAARHPRALQRLLERSVGSTRREPLRRLVQHVDDHALVGLVDMLAGSEARELNVIARALVQLVGAARPGRGNDRVTVWCAVLRSSSSGAMSASTESLGFVDALLHELAVALDSATPTLCDELSEVIERGDHDCPASLRGAIERSATLRASWTAHEIMSRDEANRETAIEPHASPTTEPDESLAHVDEAAATAEPAHADATATTAATADAAQDPLTSLLDSWRTSPLHELSNTLRALTRTATDRQPLIEHLTQLTELALREGSLSRPTLRRTLALLHTTQHQAEIERALLQAVDRAALAGRTPEPAHAPAPTRATDHLPDQLHVDDAGCVIAWPFLERLFTRLELLDRKTFISPAAACRAVALLHQLVDEDPDPPEYTLPLAKLLCGLPPDAPFELDRPLERQELQESERMLEALIAHATILRDMSVADLRVNFLRREGILSTRDGGWLLQVERRSHDVVLDHFPWTWTWVRLPWMSTPLRVEW